MPHVGPVRFASRHFPNWSGPCTLYVARRGKTPLIELNAAKAFGYKLAILPTLLFRGVIYEELLTELNIGAFPTSPKDLSLHEAFARFRADEWDSLRDRYRDVSKAVAVALGRAACCLKGSQPGIELVA